jgi:hypothetical protein
MTWYPACAATPENDGPNFEPPVIGRAFQRGQARLREAEAFSSMQKEATKFHERMAKKHGVDRPVGLAHFRAATAYREGLGRLQEMFDKPGEQISPKHQMKAHKASIKFHKKQAEKAGLNSPLAHAHLHAMEHHMDGLHQLKQQEAKAGFSGKQSPVPVPKKADQPSEDIHQNLPPVPLKKLQQKQEAKIRSFGRKREREGDGAGPYEGKPTFPRSDRAIMKPDLVFRGKKPRPGKYGPKSDKPVIHDAANDRESSEGGPGSGPRGGGKISGSVSARIKGYKIIQGSGPHDGKWAAVGHGEHKIYDNEKDAINHAKYGGPFTIGDQEHTHGHESRSRRSLRRRPIWETDDSERDRSASGLTA